jgi:hypothetical protein
MLGKYRPSSLKGALNKNKYFEGWFQKVYSSEHQASFVIIYGYATANSPDTFGFIQLLLPGKLPWLYYFPKNEISFDKDNHIMVMGTNKLSKDLIEINTKDISIKLNFKNNQLIQSFKNSMGYSYFVPNLPCYHSVLNPSHVVSGEIRYDDGQYSLVNEMGYLEKNWGTSFPENYFWLHAIDPKNPQISLLFSRAEIKWLGKKFIRHVGHLRVDGIEIDLRELRNISITTLDQNTEVQIIRFESKSLKLYISINIGKNVILKGPTNGALSRDIDHHADAVIDVKMSTENKIRQFQMVGNFEKINTPAAAQNVIQRS